MAREKVDGIAIKVVKYGEHDKMLTLFTHSRGKISAVAKGAQSSKSKYLAACQPFVRSEFVLSRSSEARAYYVVSAGFTRGFQGLNQDLERVVSAGYIAELTDLFYENDAGEEITFNLLFYTLHLLENARAGYSYFIALMFALKLMGITGIFPQMNECVVCAQIQSHYIFDYALGGLCCPACAANTEFPVLKDTEARFLHGVLNMDMKDAPFISLPDISTLKFLLFAVNGYIHYSTGKTPKSFELLYKL